MADEVAAKGKHPQQQGQQQAHGEGQHGTDQAIDYPMGAGEPWRERPDDLTQDDHLRQVDAEGALAQQWPPRGGCGMGRAVIAARGKTLYHGKQQRCHGDVVDTDVAGDRVDVLLPRDTEVALKQELEQRHHDDAECQQQRPLPAMTAGEYGQAVAMHVVAQQHIAVVVGKGAEHVVAVLRGLDEDAMLIGNER